MAVENVSQIFDEFLPNRFKDKPDLAGKIGSSYKFIITGDEEGTWVLDLDKGGEIKKSDDDAKCTITVGGQDFVDIINGKLNAQMAFMGGKLKVAGDMGMALKLQSIIG